MALSRTSSLQQLRQQPRIGAADVDGLCAQLATAKGKARRALQQDIHALLLDKGDAFESTDLKRKLASQLVMSPEVQQAAHTFESNDGVIDRREASQLESMTAGGILGRSAHNRFSLAAVMIASKMDGAMLFGASSEDHAAKLIDLPLQTLEAKEAFAVLLGGERKPRDVEHMVTQLLHQASPGQRDDVAHDIAVFAKAFGFDQQEPLLNAMTMLTTSPVKADAVLLSMRTPESSTYGVGALFVFEGPRMSPDDIHTLTKGPPPLFPKGLPDDVQHYVDGLQLAGKLGIAQDELTPEAASFLVSNDSYNDSLFNALNVRQHKAKSERKWEAPVHSTSAVEQVLQLVGHDDKRAQRNQGEVEVLQDVLQAAKAGAGDISLAMVNRSHNVHREQLRLEDPTDGLQSLSRPKGHPNYGEVDMRHVPTFSPKGVSVADVKQGALGDCYLCSPALALVEHRPDLLQKLVVEDDRGIHIRLHRVDHVADYLEPGGGSQHGKLPKGDAEPLDRDVEQLSTTKSFGVDEVPVDKLFPQNDRRKPAYGQSESGLFKKPSTWFPLVEQAWVRSYGNYGDVEGGIPSATLTALTGAPTEHAPHHLQSASALVDDIHQALAQGDLVTCDTHNLFDYAGTGLVGGHAYMVSGVEGEGADRKVLVRNPHKPTKTKAFSVEKFHALFQQSWFNRCGGSDGASA